MEIFMENIKQETINKITSTFYKDAIENQGGELKYSRLMEIVEEYEETITK